MNGRSLPRVLVALALHAALATAAPAHATELHPFDASSMQAIRSSHAGSAFVVAFWSITCEPCRDEMRDWRKLLRRHPGLPVIFVTTDPPSDRKAVLEFIARYGPRGGQHWEFADSYAERLRYSVDPTWRGELPRTYFFDAAQRVERRSGRLDAARVDDWIGTQMRATKPAGAPRHRPDGRPVADRGPDR